MDPITRFAGDYAFLSNFYPSPLESKISHRGELLVAATVEHAFQASKTTFRPEQIEVLLADSPRRAKFLGYRVTMRPRWDETKDAVMRLLVARKFVEHPELRAKLLATGEARLEEGNTWDDDYWGTVNGQGRNRLGVILMEVRAEILRAQQTG